METIQIGVMSMKPEIFQLNWTGKKKKKKETKTKKAKYTTLPDGSPHSLLKDPGPRRCHADYYPPGTQNQFSGS